jgi:hypothetical protein
MQVAVANNVKDRFYDHELPLLEDVSTQAESINLVLTGGPAIS